MNTLERQLLEYGAFHERQQDGLVLDEITVGEVTPLTSPSSRSRRRFVAIAAAAAAAVLLLIGGVALLGGEEPSPVTQLPPATTTPAPVTTTPSPPTTLTPPTTLAESPGQQPIIWTRLPDLAVFAGESISDVTFGPDGFVAVGTAAWHSPDGSTWSRVGDFTAGAVIHGSAGYVALGRAMVEDQEPRTAEVWRSADGVTWENTATLTSGGNVSIDRLVIAHGDAGYVAVGTLCCVLAQGGSSFVAYWRSDDGVDWLRADAPTFTAQYIAITDIAFGGGRYLAVGTAPGLPGGTDDGVILVSTDGLTWTKVDDPALSDQRGESFQRVAGVAYGDTGWVVVGEDDASLDTEFVTVDGAVWHSPDGHTWTRIPHDPDLFAPSGREGVDTRELELLGVAHGAAGYVAVGLDIAYDLAGVPTATAVAFRSEDGVNWDRLVIDDQTFEEVQAESIAFGAGIYVAVGFYFDAGEAAAVWIGTPNP